MSDELKRFVSERVPFFRTLGLEIVELSKDQAVFEVEYRESLTQSGVLHGGVIASLIDSACACVAIAHTHPEAYATTIDLQVAYLRAVTHGRIRAVATCTRAGGRVLFCEARVLDEDGAVVATGTSQLLRLPLQEGRSA